MTTPNFGISTSLKQSWFDRLRKLQAAEIKVTDVLRAGIEIWEARLAKEKK